MKHKNIGKLFVVGAVVLLTMLVLSSSGLAVTESTKSSDLLSNESTRDPCHIYGNVYYRHGERAVGVNVSIWVWRGQYTGWTGPVTVTTGQYGDFSWDTYLAHGFIVRCASLGDVVDRVWPGGAYMYFDLHQQIQIRNPYDIHDDPVGDP